MTTAHTCTSAPPLAADRRTPVTIWELLVWAYQDQRAGRLGLGRHHTSKVRWAEYLVSLDGDGAKPGVHPDAGAVHRVVCGVLDPAIARLIIEAAESGFRPEPSTMCPRPEPIPNDERGGAPHVVRGEWVEIDPIRLTAAEQVKLQSEEDHGIIERRAGPGCEQRWKYRVDLRPRRRIRKARRLVDARTGKSWGDGPSGFARGDHVWSAWCPIRYDPDPAYIAMTHEIARLFEEALIELGSWLADIPFRTRRLLADRPEI